MDEQEIYYDTQEPSLWDELREERRQFLEDLPKRFPGFARLPDQPKAVATDTEPLPAAVASRQKVPASTAGRTLRDLFTRPKGAAGAKRSQPGADVPKPAPEPPVGGMGLDDLRSEVCHLRVVVRRLEGLVQQMGIPPAPPAGASPASPPQPDLQRHLQQLQSRTEKELQQLKDEIKSHVASTQQVFQSQEKELYGALHSDFEAGLGDMRQQVSRLDRQSRYSNLIIHAPTDCGRQQLLDRCRALLRPHAAAQPLDDAALQPVRTRSTKHKLWRLQLSDGWAKHALFRHSSSLRRDRLYLDDDLTQQQLEGRRGLGDRKLQLKAAGHKTWWRRDVLHWADSDGVHSQSPSSA